MRDICGSMPPALLDLIPSETFFTSQQTLLTLNNEEHQKQLLVLLQRLEQANRRPELIIIDNLSSMTLGVDENSNSEQDSLIRFMLQLRHLGYSVVLIHHSGKNGEQRGASRREDQLDTVIKLSASAEPSPMGNAKFLLEFSKKRGRMPTPAVLECELIEMEVGRIEWTWSAEDREIPPWIEALRFVQTMKPKAQDEIATALDVGKPAVSKYLKKAREKGLLSDLEVTPAGEKYLRKIYGSSEEEEAVNE
jgi:hypothetical protein